MLSVLFVQLYYILNSLKKQNIYIIDMHMHLKKMSFLGKKKKKMSSNYAYFFGCLHNFYLDQL